MSCFHRTVSDCPAQPGPALPVCVLPWGAQFSWGRGDQAAHQLQGVPVIPVSHLFFISPFPAKPKLKVSHLSGQGLRTQAWAW